ncbi:Gamma-butyrobetaine dioxygenase [Geodia barretti]|uniref:Gamma-butyrobetaine dioxygenase n=2 Tax=Geodia barretti TaxID=519541 RepID=A0AA35X607_GEOBA|nr:Gamma-butyrobetaine dioxygenase [Geodia barretti]
MSYFRLLRTAITRRHLGTSQVFRRAGTEERLSQQVTTDLLVLGGGKRLRVSWDSSRTSQSVFHSVWLRRNCQCTQCLSLYNQNVVRSHEMDPRVAIIHANLTGEGKVKMKWSCGHEGHLNLDWLRRNCYSARTLKEARRNSTPKYLQDTLPEIDSEELKEEYGVWRWLKAVSEYGACLLKGIPCTTEEGLEITRKVSPHLQETFYGGHSVVKVEENPMTLCHGPGHIEPHMDVPMYESQTGLTLLHCLRNDSCVSGGDTIVVDALAVAEKLRLTHPNHFATLVRVPVTFQRVHYDREKSCAYDISNTTHPVEWTWTGRVSLSPLKFSP